MYAGISCFLKNVYEHVPVPASLEKHLKNKYKDGNSGANSRWRNYSGVSFFSVFLKKLMN